VENLISHIKGKKEHTLRVFEHRGLSGVCGTKREQVTGDWRKLRNEDFCNFSTSRNIISVIKLKEHEMGEACSTYGIRSELDKGFSWGNLWERGRLEDPDVDIRITLVLILHK
jgi:hypothetical protein